MQNGNDRLTRRDFARTAGLAVGALSTANLVGAEEPAADLKIGLYSITYMGVWYRGDALTIEQVIDRAKRYGYQGVELDGKRPHADPLDMPKYRCRDLRRYAQEQGIELYAVAANNDFSSPMPEHREAQLLYLRELIRITADLEIKLLQVFLAWPGVTTMPEGGARYDISFKAWADTHRDFPELACLRWTAFSTLDTTVIWDSNYAISSPSSMPFGRHGVYGQECAPCGSIHALDDCIGKKTSGRCGLMPGDVGHHRDWMMDSDAT
jgi:hypothetical protein